MKKWIALGMTLLMLASAVCLPSLAGWAPAALAASESSSSPASPVSNATVSEKTKTVPVYKGSATKCTLVAGQTLTLKTKSSSAVTWTSSDKKIAAISNQNKVVAKTAGSVVLEGTNGSDRYVVKLTVKASLKASSTSVSVNADSEKTVKMTYKHDGYLSVKIKNKKIVQAYWDDSWTSKGTIKLHLVGLKKGSTTVTVSNSITKETVKIKVTVKETASSSAKYRAFLVGNSNYYYENQLPNHKWDVTAMKGLLTKSLTTSYTVKTKLDATASDILNGISSAFSGAKESDVSLFYYGGHGVEGSGSLRCVDGSTVYATQLRDALLKVPGRVIVILDCCFSGSYIANGSSEADQETDAKQNPAADFNQSFVNAFSGYTIVDQEEGIKPNYGELLSSKFIVLTSCQWYEESWNWWYNYYNVDQSFGTFTKAMFNGLGCAWSTGVYSGSAPCDTNNDGVATLGECAKYIRKTATSINAEMGYYHEQNCASYGDDNYKLFKLKK